MKKVKRGTTDWQGIQIRNEQVWECKIGGATPEEIHFKGSFDIVMRRAVAKAYFEITGRNYDYCFSGWNAELTESEIASIEENLDY